MRKPVAAVGVVTALVVAGAAAAIARSPIDPVAVFVLPALPRPVEEVLDRMAVFDLGADCGPEDVAFDAAGALHTGCADGRILRVDVAATPPRTDVVANTGGRPFGLRFAADGTLLVADGVRGLLAVKDGAVRVLVREAGGVPFGFTDELDVAGDGTVYFSDASSAYGVGRYDLDIIEGRTHGRLLRHDPRTGATQVLMDDLAFGNGVALAADDSFVLVNETARYRVRRHWLTGPRAGTSDVFLDRLPGFPDNLSRSPRGTYWIALHSPRNALLDALHPHPLAKRLVAGLPQALKPHPERAGTAIEVDAAGTVLRVLSDADGSRMWETTTAEERDGVLWIGSLVGRTLGRFPLEPR